MVVPVSLSIKWKNKDLDSHSSTYALWMSPKCVTVKMIEIEIANSLILRKCLKSKMAKTNFRRVNIEFK